MDHRLLPNGNNGSVNALLLLFVFDKMDVPITEQTLAEIVCTHNDWLSYMDYRQAFALLVGKNWVAKLDRSVADSEAYWSLTVDGRVCLSHLYYNIPSRTRADIVEYINTNRMHYRRKQEYGATYYRNEDGTYNVLLRITDTTKTIFEITICIPDRTTAAAMSREWEKKAAETYHLVFEQLEP